MMGRRPSVAMPRDPFREAWPSRGLVEADDWTKANEWGCIPESFDGPEALRGDTGQLLRCGLGRLGGLVS